VILLSLEPSRSALNIIILDGTALIMFCHQITRNVAIKYLELLVRIMVLLSYIGCDIC